VKKLILDLCGGTGAWSKPYADNPDEYERLIITYPDYDVCTFDPPDNVYGILAAPPCTMFSRARTNDLKQPRDLVGAMKVVNACLSIIHKCLYKNVKNGLRFWALENPSTGYLKKFLGYPHLIFQPYEYGDPYTKQTALWGYFNIPKKKPVEPLTSDNTIFIPAIPSMPVTNFVCQPGNFAFLKNEIPTGYKEKTGYRTDQILRSMTPSGFANAFYKANR